MAKKTQTEIAAEVVSLREIKAKVRKKSIFGDNHHDAIDAQIYVLENNLNESQMADRYCPDESIEEEESQPQNVYDSAQDAITWRNGKLEYATLVETWQELVQE